MRYTNLRPHSPMFAVSVRQFVSSSVCLSHWWSTPKRFSLSNCSLRRTINWYYSIFDAKFRSCEFRDSPRTNKSSRGTPVKSENAKLNDTLLTLLLLLLLFLQTCFFGNRKYNEMNFCWCVSRYTLQLDTISCYAYCYWHDNVRRYSVSHRLGNKKKRWANG